MILKFNNYITESIKNDNSIIDVFSLKFNINKDISYYPNTDSNIFFNIKNKINTNTTSYINNMFRERFFNILNKYKVSNSKSPDKFYLNYQTKLYLLFYLIKIKNLEIKKIGDMRYHVYSINNTIKYNIDIFKNFFKHDINIMNYLINKYVDEHEYVDDIVLTCLNEKQKKKYQHLINAKNFDLI